MDKRIQRLDTVKKCEIFARNASERGRPDLVLEARQKAVVLNAMTESAI